MAMTIMAVGIGAITAFVGYMIYRGIKKNDDKTA
jgi:hypothetical protein